MAFELLPAPLAVGLEPQAIKTLGTLKHLITLTPPITEAVMRTVLETGQPIVPDGRATAFTNAGWLSFVGQIAAIELDDTALTTAERTLINTLRSISNPPPSLDCCGVTPVVSALTSIYAYERVGFANFAHTVELTLDVTTECDIKSVSVTPTPIGLAPAIISTTPFKVLFKKCDSTGRVFSFLNVLFAADPSGLSYSLSLDFLDANGVSITSFVPAYNLNIP